MIECCIITLWQISDKFSKSNEGHKRKLFATYIYLLVIVTFSLHHDFNTSKAYL